MTDTPNRGIPYVPEGALDPAAGLNLSLDVIDALLQTAVIRMDLTTPPGLPSDGDLYIPASPATDAWAGLENHLVRYRSEGGLWQSYTPGVQVGLLLNLDDGGLYKFDQSSSPGSWVLAAGLSDAPADGDLYGRRDGDWEAVDSLTVADEESPQTIDTGVTNIVAGDGLNLEILGAGVVRLSATGGGGGGGGGMTLLGSDVAGGAVAALSVTGIPATFDHLLIVVNGRGDAAAQVNRSAFVRFNNDSGTNYDYENVHAYSTATAAAQAVAQTSGFCGDVPAAAATANRSGSSQFTVPNYAGTTFDKQARGTFGATLGAGAFNVGSGHFSFDWRPVAPAAINRVDVILQSGNWVAGSGIWVYGF